jgi:hypothetical protein
MAKPRCVFDSEQLRRKRGKALILAANLLGFEVSRMPPATSRTKSPTCLVNQCRIFAARDALCTAREANRALIIR